MFNTIENPEKLYFIVLLIINNILSKITKCNVCNKNNK